MNSFVQVAADGPGKKIQTFESIIGPDTVEAQAVVLVDQFGDPISIEPAGLDQELQFNDGGAFAGAAQFTWDKAQNSFYAGTPSASLGIGSDQFIALAQNVVAFKGSKPALVVVGEEVGTGDIQGADGIVGLATILGLVANEEAIGIQGIAILDGGTASPFALIGLYGEAYIQSGSGTIGFLAAVQAATNNFGSAGAITINDGVRIEDQRGVGATNHALHILDQGTGANDYAIKVDGGKSQFDGPIILKNLPISDPAVDGQLWNNRGILTVSAG